MARDALLDLALDHVGDGARVAVGLLGTRSLHHNANNGFGAGGAH